MIKPIILILTGPTGVGKTTLCKMVADRFNYTYVSGDEIKEKLFPGVEDITVYPEKLADVKKELLKRAKEIFDNGNSVVIDYVILGEEYIKKIKELFDGHLVFKVLLPTLESIQARDKERECWTAGEESVKDLYEKYLKLKPLIGKENYIDTTDETPEETFNNHFNRF